jgi:hypothetical protein
MLTVSTSWARRLMCLVLLSTAVVGGPLIMSGPAAAAGGNFVTMQPADPADESYVIDVANWGTADRSPVHTWHINLYGDYSNQLWTALQKSISGTTRTIELIGNQSNKCLDKSEDNGNVNGAAVYIYTCSGAANQLWRYNPTPAGWSDLRNVADPNRCLTSYGPYDGAVVDVENCEGTLEQSWHVGDLYP